jgi:hypothetical protein
VRRQRGFGDIKLTVLQKAAVPVAAIPVMGLHANLQGAQLHPGRRRHGAHEYGYMPVVSFECDA